MSEISKYETLLNDLLNIESEVSILVEKLKVTTEKLKEKELQIAVLKQENQNLSKKVSELEYQIENIKTSNSFPNIESINIENSEILKTRIKNLINKIDYYLSS
jgi:DNA repair exonuclease SbcCD ATPase subunit